jgi:hypothetical protein
MKELLDKLIIWIKMKMYSINILFFLNLNF